MTSYESVRSDWWALLKWHLKINGTRPNNSPQTRSPKWTAKEFAQKCNVGATPEYGTRTVYDWLDKDKRQLVSNSYFNAIESALFGRNTAYDAWRLDLRAAYVRAQEEKASLKAGRLSRTQLSPIRERSDVSVDPDALLFGIRQGVLMRINGQTLVTRRCLRDWARNCRDRTLLDINRFDTIIGNCESTVKKLIFHLLWPALRDIEWTNEDKLLRVLDGLGYHVHGILIRKACEVGIYKKIGDDYVNDADVLYSLVCAFDRYVSDQPTDDEILVALYNSWRDVLTVAFENVPGENNTDYIDILSILIYANACDNGSVESFRLRPVL